MGLAEGDIHGLVVSHPVGKELQTVGFVQLHGDAPRTEDIEVDAGRAHSVFVFSPGR